MGIAAAIGAVIAGVIGSVASAEIQKNQAEKALNAQQEANRKAQEQQDRANSLAEQEQNRANKEQVNAGAIIDSIESSGGNYGILTGSQGIGNSSLNLGNANSLNAKSSLNTKSSMNSANRLK